MGFDASFASFPGAMLGPATVLDDGNAEASIAALMATAEQSENVRGRLLREQKGTAELVAQLKTIPGLPEPVRQYRFHPHRRWKFDLAWPELKFAIELQGLKGHTRIGRFVADSEKALAAIGMGWTVAPAVYKHIADGKILAAVSAWWTRRQSVTVSSGGEPVSETCAYTTAKMMGS